MSDDARGTLYLHVGTHKTGTTSIQKALEIRSAALRDAGLATHPESNAWRLANSLLRPELETFARRNLGMPTPGLADILEARNSIARARGGLRDMVVSAEAFCMMRTALEAFAVREALAAGFARLVPIVVFRNPSDWRASRQSQLARTGYREPQGAVPDDRSADGAWYFDQDAILRFWNDLGPTVVIDYDSACREEGDILPAFARAIGLAGVFDGLTLRENQRGMAS